MIETLIQWDKELLVYLNNLGSTTYDPFWLFITKQLNWLPFYILLLYLVYKKVSLKTLGVVLLVIAGLIAFTDQFTNLVKGYFARPRPCNTEDIQALLRIVKCSSTNSFFSGHASNSTATMLFLFLLLRRYYKYAFLVFIFPLVFAYSRIYLSLHFPGDILVGMCAGTLTGTLFYNLFKWLEKKYKLV
ncbi:MAG: phosphatase PAP2 family protein [Myroides sp.]|jgi:undecaprenyl-diphosphatase|uniref:phosphatase PAP2 family protein n=1 Tax=Myroides TaxID=76831 RepID=UPI00257513D3|nr:phosphatase PAP2 family protein [Myroides marinus]MDR0194864.1 phosphatase PAP2 family protein [Myroides sp.]MDM1367748.1 phosphatase PAP2 family protein [Myroides marinus]MDM1371966.1 phosphatase PAP2 family protein [Myroides marinus]MDM1375906.1 phosphatase PAP2 family protein [Myroides marinus]MDM1382375.1 phosphatase PAP2 family protein [Myroides marinus]